MVRLFLLVAAVALGLCLVASDSSARLLEPWPYDKLMKKSDLVVIATAVKAEDTADKYLGHSWAYEFAGLDTTFEVLHALKGKVNGKQIKVLHFKWGELKKGIDPKSVDALLIEDGPLLVAFRTKDSPDYLLYLRALKDGRYEPVSGKIDPKLAVRVLSEPADKVP
jgi:hypothetical protein